MSTDKLASVVATVIDDETTFSLVDICRVTRATPDLVMQLVEYHIVKPNGQSEHDWQFDHVCLKRVRLARNFYHDLEVNLPGIALVLEMMERIEALESEVARLG